MRDVLDPITWCEVCICDYESEELEEHKVEVQNTNCYQKFGLCDYAVNNESKIIRHRKSHNK